MNQEQLNERLLEAAKRGDTKSVEDWVARGANVNCTGSGGWSPLHLAARYGRTETVFRLVELGGDVNNKTDDYGRSPLHLAAAKGRTETVSRLVELGGDVNDKDDRGQTPYDIARKDDIKELLKKFIEEQLEQAMKELRGLGMETVEEFRDIIKEGSYKCFWNRIYLVGPYAVGKSTLARILVGEPIPTERESTDGIWIYMGRAGMEVEQQKWKFFPKGTAIKEIIASLLMSVTNDNSQNLTRDDVINLNKGTPHLEMSTVGRNQTQIALQSAMSTIDSSQKEKLEDTPVTHQSAVSPMDSIQKEKLENVPVTYQSAISPMDSSQKEKLEDAPVTYQSAVSRMDSSQKEKLEDTPVTYQSAMSPTDSSQIDNTKNDQFLDQSAMSPIRVPQSEQFIDVPSAAEFIPVLSNYKTLDKRSEINKPFSSMSNNKIHDLVIQAIQDGKYRQKIIPIDIWDFGGQKDYYMTHQLFITSRGIYVLMFNGSVDIHKIMKDLAFLPGHFGRPTVAVYLLHWVNSILTYCKRTDDGFPRIIFVATHKDKIPRSKIKFQRKKLMDSIYDLFKSHAGIKHLEFKPLIFINSKDRKDDGIDILKQLLIERAVEHPRWGDKMPTAWVPLELQLAENVEEGIDIISRAELEMLNSQNTPMVLNQKQLNTFLKVQHSLGKLLYFDSAKLRDFIIINPSYMVGVLRSIVTEKQFWPKGDEYSSVLKQLQSTGKIRRDDIYLLWSQEHFQHILHHKEHMVEMLTHLDILVAPRTTFDDVVDSTTTSIDIGNRDFLVPCMITEPNSTHYIKRECIPTKTIILAYTFIEEIIPPALAYRFLGSFITMWELKIYKGRSMLFSDLAVVEIDENHDVTVQVKGNRVVVSLVHSNRKENIVPTLASSIQECLTASVHRISEFYSTLSGDEEKAANTTIPFKVEFGVLCNKRFFENTWHICFFSQRELTQSLWTCPVHNRKHDIQSLHLWFTEKIPLERCIDSCAGLGIIERNLVPSDKHLCRIASMLNVETCRQLVIHLGLELNAWERLEYQFMKQNPVNITFTALIKWKQNQSEPTFGLLQKALEDCREDVHKLCQVFRDITTDTSGLTEETLSKKPTNKALQSLLDHIGDSVMELGVELGLDFSEIESIQYEYKNKLKDQARAVMKCWMDQSRERPTVRTIVKALHRIGKKGCTHHLKF